jgi:ubiquinone/menaquinone biosynthesis C-methylase UbiE
MTRFWRSVAEGGYFSIAATTVSSNVIGLDMMNGLGRHDWWSNFKETVRELYLKSRIAVLKAVAQVIPLKEGSVKKVVAVHSIRNFQSKQAIQSSISEINRVLMDDGEMVIAETLPSARNNAQKAPHLAFYRCKCKYDWVIFPISHKKSFLKCSMKQELLKPLSK